MQNGNIDRAIAEAKRFLERAKALKEAQKETYQCGEHTFHCDAPKESGALRRSSLDLTRALAEMRRP